VNKSYCQLCGEIIAGKSKTYHHESWPVNLQLQVCNRCEKTRPRCKICRIPILEKTPNGACQTCNGTLQYCLTCGDPIIGRFKEFDSVGPYCQKCCLERLPCDICSAPLSDQKWKLSDGRVLCVYCHGSTIVTKEQAQSLYEQMKSVADNILGMRLNVPTGLALVDRNQLQKVIQQQHITTGANGNPNPQLDTEHTLGLYARKGMRRGIYVQSGLPRLLFLQVAAHEFAHAWQGENCPLLKTPVYHEGFAEWAAYQVIGHYGYVAGQSRMLARQDIYGQGLHLMLELFASSGVPGVLETCRRMV
jgi:hypothetical protein